MSSFREKTSQPIILLIFSCKQYAHKVQRQKQTWLPQLSPNILYFHVVADPTLTSTDTGTDPPYILNVKKHKLIVGTPDDYVSLPKKVIAAFRAMYNEYIFKYIFKTDDDQLCTNPGFLSVLINLLNKKTPTVHYAGHFIDVHEAYLSQYHQKHPELPSHLPILPTTYCTGRFYVVSSMAVQFLIHTKQADIERECLEDYAIGFHFHPLLKSPTHIMKIDTSKYFVDMDLDKEKEKEKEQKTNT